MIIIVTLLRMSSRLRIDSNEWHYRNDTQKEYIKIYNAENHSLNL